jgi:ferritin-like metal-binding protein YciE
MNAAISGRLGIAFEVDGNTCHSRSANAPFEKVPRQPWEFSCLFSDATDVTFVDDIDASQLEDRLILEVNKAKTLHFTLAILDSGLTATLRLRLAAWLNEVDDRALGYAQNVLFSAPLPNEADFGLAHFLNGQFKRVSSFYSALQRFQPTISFVRHCWQTIVMSAEVRKDCEHILVREGAFKLLVENCFSDEAREQAFKAIGELPALKAVEESAALIAAWANIFDHLIPVLVGANPKTPNTGTDDESSQKLTSDPHHLLAEFKNIPFFIELDAAAMFRGVRDWIVRSTMTEPTAADVLWESIQSPNTLKQKERDPAVRAWDQAAAWLGEENCSSFEQENAISDWLGSSYRIHPFHAFHHEDVIRSEEFGSRKETAHPRSLCRVFLSHLRFEANTAESGIISCVIKEWNAGGVKVMSVDHADLILVIPTVFIVDPAESKLAVSALPEEFIYQPVSKRNDLGDTAVEKWLAAGQAQLINQFYPSSRGVSLASIKSRSPIWGYIGAYEGIRYASPYPFVRFVVCDDPEAQRNVSITGLSRETDLPYRQAERHVYSGSLAPIHGRLGEVVDKRTEEIDAIVSGGVDALKQLYIQELRDLYSAENQLIKALPKMAKAAKNRQLASRFSQHHEQSKRHLRRLEEILESQKVSRQGPKCQRVEGLIAEGNRIAAQETENDLRDVGLIGTAQSVEHYEIAGYGCARTFAKLLDDKKAVRLLEMTLREEGETEKKLNELAKFVIKLRTNRDLAS